MFFELILVDYILQALADFNQTSRLIPNILLAL